MESNDSPEIPDRGETSDIPGLPSGGIHGIAEVSDGVHVSLNLNDNNLMAEKKVWKLLQEKQTFNTIAYITSIRHEQRQMVHSDT